MPNQIRRLLDDTSLWSQRVQLDAWRVKVRRDAREMMQRVEIRGGGVLSVVEDGRSPVERAAGGRKGVGRGELAGGEDEGDGGGGCR